MKRTLVASDELRELIRHVPPNLKRKIKLAIQEIVTAPSSGKGLQEELLGLCSYRVGEVRIVYRVEGQSVQLVTIGPRKTVYQKAALELKRQAKT